MAIFRPKPCNFLFLQRRKAFFLSRISQKTFSWSKLPKKKSWKNGHFGLKKWVNPLGKMSIFRLSELLVFYSVERLFFFQNITKDIFLASISLKKIGKTAIFGPKPWDNPLGKISIFRVFELFVLIAQKGVFSFQNIVKDIILV